MPNQAILPTRVGSCGFTLTELMAAIAILGLLAALALPRTESVRTNGNRAACYVSQAEIEVQAMLWRRVNGTWPLSDLSDIGADTDYFPEGVSLCPFDGSVYTIDSDGHVINHDH